MKAAKGRTRLTLKARVRELVRAGRRHAAPVLGACAVAYFSYHAIEGDRGLVAWYRTAHEIDVARAKLEVSLAEQRALEHDVSLLRPESLDRDMLDEQVRRILNYAHADELVVLVPAAAATPAPETSQ
jgi:cell division protein FtsB